MRSLLTAFAILAALAPTLRPLPALALDCVAEAEAEMARLGLRAADITSVQYVEKINPSETGPGVLGVRAWVRLAACGNEGYLVIDTTRSCFVRQSYTRGGCRLDGVTAY